MMWGSNVPVTRTPDAHWMAEVRYRGTKVVTVSPDYADNVKFADEWLPAQAGTDAALAMAMGHVILKENFVDRQVPFFTDYVKQYTDLPMLVTLVEHPDGHGLTAAKFLTAADLPDHAAETDAAFKTVLWDAKTNTPAVPGGTMGQPLQRGRPGQVEPRPGRPEAGAQPGGRGRTPSPPRSRCPASRTRAGRARSSAAASRPCGWAITWSPPSST